MSGYDAYKTGRKELIFEEGIRVSGTFSAGGGNAIVHNGARAGQSLSMVQAPTAIGQGKSDVVIHVKKAPEVKDASVGMQNTMTVNYVNDSNQEREMHLPSEPERRFRRRTQMEREGVKDYAADMRKLASACHVPVSEAEIIKQFIAGLKHPKMKEKMLTLEALTFDKAVEAALHMESVLY